MLFAFRLWMHLLTSDDECHRFGRSPQRREIAAHDGAVTERADVRAELWRARFATFSRYWSLAEESCRLRRSQTFVPARAALQMVSGSI